MTATGIDAQAALLALCGRWVVVPDESRAGFRVRDKLVSTARGVLPVEDGEIVISPSGEVSGAWITASVHGIDTGNIRRDEHLRSASLLDTARFPSLRIAVESFTGTTDGATARAVVRARNVRVPLDLAVTLVGQDDATTDGRRLRIRVTGRLDRSRLGLRAPRLIIGRFVDLDAELTFRAS